MNNVGGVALRHWKTGDRIQAEPGTAFRTDQEPRVITECVGNSSQLDNDMVKSANIGPAAMNRIGVRDV
jgi:hypothetical protein